MTHFYVSKHYPRRFPGASSVPGEIKVKTLCRGELISLTKTDGVKSAVTTVEKTTCIACIELLIEKEKRRLAKLYANRDAELLKQVGAA